MIYDYAIIGAGVSGPICAYQLARHGKKCILIEKNSIPSEKICGGGVSYKALRCLRTIGIQTDPLFSEDSKRIVGHSIKKIGKISDLKLYNNGKISLGIQRNIFDSYLLRCATDEGAAIIYGHRVDNVKDENGLYKIANFWSKEVVWATGAKSTWGAVIEGQSIGYSGQIYAKSKLASNLFHYWYYEKDNENKYFWSFPIGENLWNVGIWSRNPFPEMKKEYNSCLENLFVVTIDGEWKYHRIPKAEFLGHIDQRENNQFMRYGVGDLAGKCNPKNGGGIIGAIESSIELTEKLLK